MKGQLNSSVRRAFTLIELIVTITIIALLLALLLVGVQAAREAARSYTCFSNLRQIGLAIANYESQYSMMPPAMGVAGSVHVGLLPYLEQPELYRRIVAESSKSMEERDALSIRMSIFECPSDGVDSALSHQDMYGANYASSTGTWYLSGNFDGAFRMLHEFNSGALFGPVRIGDFTDGTSQTASFSEILRSDGSLDRLRVVWLGPSHTNLDDFREACVSSAASDSLSCESCRGTPWVNGTPGYTTYNHAITPNNPSCNRNGFTIEGASTASSSHNSGIHVLYVDGHVQFVAETIDVEPWLQMGSRDSESLR
ncbi:hypothetical protein FF011L_24760 [Roseimaritima multifibrata]|uniref:DUF1559 domain-containing protein n=1 Tax=Roseimaritima multifibrata TaxID=1930274 RepID=A0A517MFP0_9BACT|nr:DUF1559 domain-containing protein [Roseimaritima multifibrata]QDS93703.1 hypothetical protein FF011L_24760 [Roseimaritima multifibrata]